MKLTSCTSTLHSLHSFSYLYFSIDEEETVPTSQSKCQTKRKNKTTKNESIMPHVKTIFQKVFMGNKGG